MKKISINNNGANKCIRVRACNTQLSDKNNNVYKVREEEGEKTRNFISKGNFLYFHEGNNAFAIQFRPGIV